VGALYVIPLPVTNQFVIGNKFFPFRAFSSGPASCGPAIGGKSYLEVRALAEVVFRLSAPEEWRAMR
jgi:hypothetical protein